MSEDPARPTWFAFRGTRDDKGPMCSWWSTAVQKVGREAWHGAKGALRHHQLIPDGDGAGLMRVPERKGAASWAGSAASHRLSMPEAWLAWLVSRPFQWLAPGAVSDMTPDGGSVRQVGTPPAG